MIISDNRVQFHSVFEFKVYICAMCYTFSSYLHFFHVQRVLVEKGCKKINTVILPQGLDVKNISFQKQRFFSMKNDVGIV